MTRSRVYRHDIRCSYCGSNWMRQNGFTNGRQACHCVDCRRIVVMGGAPSSAAVKEQGIARYVAGSRLSAIRRLPGYSPSAILGWVKRGSAALNRLREQSAQQTDGAAFQQPGGSNLQRYVDLARGTAWGMAVELAARDGGEGRPGELE